MTEDTVRRRVTHFQEWYDGIKGLSERMENRHESGVGDVLEKLNIVLCAINILNQHDPSLESRARDLRWRMEKNCGIENPLDEPHGRLVGSPLDPPLESNNVRRRRALDLGDG